MLEEEVSPRLTAYVQPGELFVSTRPTVVTTVLGSCVAVCLFDPRRSHGGLNHYLLPHGESGTPRSRRFGTVAITELIDALVARGSQPSDLLAKVFGGGDVLDAFRQGDDSLGARNVEAAYSVLQQQRIPVVSQDVRGQRGRKLIFHTHDGNAFVRLLGRPL